MVPHLQLGEGFSAAPSFSHMFRGEGGMRMGLILVLGLLILGDIWGMGEG